MKKGLFTILIFIFLSACNNHAQEPTPIMVDTIVASEVRKYPFEKEIRKYEDQDLKCFPPQEAVLFVGSSTVRLWKSLEKDMDGLTVINRGFGGAHTGHILHYMNRMVFPYHPSKIVYYCGDNDVASGVNTDTVLMHYYKFIIRVHDSLPNTKIYFVSNKPSFKRQKHLPLQKSVNEELKKICARYNFVEYVDVFSSMMVNDTVIRNDLFKRDSLHLNDKGYAIWTGIIKKRIMNN